MISFEEMYEELYRSDKRLSTAYGNNCKIDFYAFLQNEDETGSTRKYFNGKAKIFTTALLLGFFHNRKSDESPTDQFTRLKQISDIYHAGIIKMIFIAIARKPENSGKDPDQVFLEMCKYADGGIEILQDDYNNNQELNMDTINFEVEKKIEEMANEIISGNSNSSESDQ
ncbi:MAG: hypothetical protein CL763_08125 [Chloroflexi bacterium]|nr:hypothetical protein [Chloroflexota bacterium]|tara:strand:+ start:7510 stop:8019 length:510 start_codon:yes stop_codon:yes gene_type:complete